MSKSERKWNYINLIQNCRKKNIHIIQILMETLYSITTANGFKPLGLLEPLFIIGNSV